MLNKFREIIKQFRIYNTRSMILFYYFGLMLSEEFRLSYEIVIVPVIFILVYSSASLANYLVDIKTDRLNRKPNPFAGSKISARGKIFTLLPVIFALILAYFTKHPFLTFFLISITIFLSFLYSSKVKGSYYAFPKFIIMALGYCFLPGVFGLLYGEMTLANFFTVVAFTLLFSSYLPYSDIKDIKGDKAAGKNTLAVRFGVNKLPVFGLLISAIGFGVLATLTNYLSDNQLVTGIAAIFLTGHVILFIFPEFLHPKKLYSFVGYLLYLLLVLLLFSLS